MSNGGIERLPEPDGFDGETTADFLRRKTVEILAAVGAEGLFDTPSTLPAEPLSEPQREPRQ